LRKKSFGVHVREIVGTSASLQTVLSRVSEVAHADSSVLITGRPAPARNWSPAPFTGVPGAHHAHS
jgi:hypothetical protein